MCKPASFVLTKTKVFWSRHTDSHTEIIAEHGLNEDGVRGVNVVKIEISPEDGDLSSDPSTWVYKLDQDSTPDWYDAAKCEKRARVELAKWVAARVITGDIDALKEPGKYWLYSGTIKSVSGGTIESVYGGTIKSVSGDCTISKYSNRAKIAEPSHPMSNAHRSRQAAASLPVRG
jgi:hypothetical protein